MGRHAAPEGRHRRHGALLAQTALISVLVLVAAAVLLGSNMARDRTVDGTFASSQTGEQASPDAEVPETSAESPTETGAAPEATVMPPGAASSESPLPSDPHERVNPTESRGVSPSGAPMTSSSAADAPDATTATTTVTATPEPARKFATCAEAKAAGVSMIPSADPRYAPRLDHDGDGVACDQHGDPPTRHVPVPTTPPATDPTRCVPAGG
jgi:cytoskeletal protein RodZ